MKSSPWLLLIGVVLLAGLSHALAADPNNRIYLPQISCPNCTGSAPTTPPPATPPPATPNPDTEEAQMIELINQARVQAGCPAAQVNATLMTATGDWSAYMKATSDYRHSYDKYPDYYRVRYGYPGAPYENIGSADTAEYMFEGWMLSDVHKRAILFCFKPGDVDYHPATTYQLGVGYGNGYWTMALGEYTP